ncbi:MAG: hypothetical protein LBG44_00165 [Gemmatimonadota bacterium]|jgi:hypothetical protein|nr:hypothetical protein [Gemmatimonadota bacterium]
MISRNCIYNWSATTVLLGASLLALPQSALAQASGSLANYEAVFQRNYPEVHALVLRLNHAQETLFGELVAEGMAVRSSPDLLPSPTFEFDMLERLGILAGEGGELDVDEGGSESGYATLGSRAAGIIEWGNQFRLAVMGIISDPTLTEFQARRAKLAEAVALYQARPEAALPTVPKNMDILYSHAQAQAFRTGYTDLDGLIWAGHWYKLAIAKPFVDLSGAERVAGLDTIQARYFAKLSYGDPPNFFPSELPLAPAIAPELSFLNPQTVAILDNLTMFEEVIADILVSPTVPDERAGVETAVDFFLDPKRGVTTSVEFGAMALRHGIFFQGGFPLIYMAESERNAGGHHGGHVGGGM